MVVTLSIFITMAMVYAALAVDEIYPFAPYTMYAQRYTPEYNASIRVFFVDSEDNDAPMLDIQIHPMDVTRLAHSIDMLVDYDKDWEVKVYEKLKDVFQLYKTNVRGNTLYKGIVVYDYRWKNIDEMRVGEAEDKVLIKKYKEE